MFFFKLINGFGDKYPVKVSPRGELAVSNVEYSEAYNATAGTPDVAANFLGPQPDKFFAITGITLRANQQVSNTADATVVIYEADAPDSIVSTRDIFVTQMVKQNRESLTGLYLRTTPGKWINIKTTDDDIYATIFGYYTKTD